MLPFFKIFFICIIALLHIYFMVLEMFFWDKPRGLKAFGMKKEDAQKSKVLAQNQGLYNGFLAAGLIWSAIELETIKIAWFFLICVILAGIYGTYTTKNKKLFLVQSLPAIFALLITLIN